MLSCGGCLGAGGARGSKATRAEIAENGVWYELHAERLTPSLEVMLRATSDAFPITAETPTALYGSQWMSEGIFVLLPASDAGPETFRVDMRDRIDPGVTPFGAMFLKVQMFWRNSAKLCRGYAFVRDFELRTSPRASEVQHDSHDSWR